MSDFSLTLVLRLTTSKIINDVAKVQMKSEKITPFGGIFHVREHNMEIKLPVLPKAVFLLFLHHPDALAYRNDKMAQ